MSENLTVDRPTRSTTFTKAAGYTAVACSALMLGSMVNAGVASAATAPVDLGTTNDYSVLAGAAVTNTGPTVMNANLGVNPGTAVSGFPPGLVGGTIHAADAESLQAQSDLVIAYDDIAGRALTETVQGDLVGRTFVDGVYKADSSLLLSGEVTLDGQGDPDSVFIFQIGSELTTASASSVNLINGANACNVYWQVGSSATLGTDSDFVGNLLALTSISATTGTDIEGRVLARNGAVTLDTNTFVTPDCAAIVAPPTDTPTDVPTYTPTDTPTDVPTDEPTNVPTDGPTDGTPPTTPPTDEATPTAPPVDETPVTPAPVEETPTPQLPGVPDSGTPDATTPPLPNQNFVPGPTPDATTSPEFATPEASETPETALVGGGEGGGDTMNGPEQLALTGVEGGRYMAIGGVFLLGVALLALAGPVQRGSLRRH